MPKQAKDEPEAREEWYKDLLENANDLIQSVAPDGRILYANRAWRETLGYGEEEIARLNLFDVIHPDSRAHCAELFQRVISGEKIDRVEAAFISKDGKRILVEGSVNCRFTDGKPVSTRGIFRDVTERKPMEKELRESEERYRLLDENVTDIIWTMDMNLRYTYMTPSVTRLRGYSVEEAMSQTLDETLTPASLRVALDALQEELAIEAMEEKDLSRTRTLELEITCKDGSTLWTEVRMTFLRDTQGRATGILGVTRDITERTQMEQMKVEFLSAVSHDFVTPLTSLKTSVELLRESPEGTLGKDSTSVLLANMARSLERLESLISDLLDISALRKASLNLSLDEVEPGSVATSAAEVVSPLIRDKGQTLNVEVQDDLPIILADGHRLEQVLVNLLSNAHKFSPAGASIALRVRHGGEHLLFDVSDNGPGIPEGEQGRIFDPFYRVHDAKVHRTVGSGIGLSIVKHLVELHGGRIWVESKVGEGSSFAFTVPLQGLDVVGSSR